MQLEKDILREYSFSIKAKNFQSNLRTTLIIKYISTITDRNVLYDSNDIMSIV